MGKGIGPYEVKAGARQPVLAQFWFTGANGANPTAVTEPTGQHYLLSSATNGGIVRDGEGSYVLSLRDDWFAIRPWGRGVGVMSTTAFHGNVDAVSTAAAANTISVTTFLANGTADDADAAVIVVTVVLYRE